MAALMSLQRIILFVLLIFLASCGAPIFRSHEERFAPAPEVIEQIEPYLERWATTPPEQTRAERQEIASQIDGILGILEEEKRVTDAGKTFYVISIILEGWGDWERGYFYVYDGSEITEHSGLQLQRVDEHFYIFNRNT